MHKQVNDGLHVVPRQQDWVFRLKKLDVAALNQLQCFSEFPLGYLHLRPRKRNLAMRVRIGRPSLQ